MNEAQLFVSQLDRMHGASLTPRGRLVRPFARRADCDPLQSLVARDEGRQRMYRLNAEPLQEASMWLEHYRAFWTARLASLEEYLLKKEGDR